MKGLKINFDKRTIVMTRKFAELASDPFTTEFAKLQEARNAYPNFQVKRHTIKKNPNKECYKGLTYEYMREYIKTYESKAEAQKVLAELEDKIFIAQCHSNCHRYPVIKRWFLEKYPNVKNHGIDEEIKVSEIKVENFEVAKAA